MLAYLCLCVVVVVVIFPLVPFSISISPFFHFPFFFLLWGWSGDEFVSSLLLCSLLLLFLSFFVCLFPVIATFVFLLVAVASP